MKFGFEKKYMQHITDLVVDFTKLLSFFIILF
jgi:hypothetical protein